MASIIEDPRIYREMEGGVYHRLLGIEKSSDTMTCGCCNAIQLTVKICAIRRLLMYKKLLTTVVFFY